MTLLSDILKAAGFTGAGLATAEGVATAESGANAAAHNTRRPDNSYGLFQINMIDSLGPARRAQYGLASNDSLLDPLTNAKVAYKMSKGGTSWGPWTTFTSKAYLAFLGKDRTVTNAGSGAAPAPSGGATAAEPAGLLPSIPSASDIGSTITRAAIVAAAVAAGAGLVLLGVNKAAGWPGIKAGKAAAGAIL